MKIVVLSCDKNVDTFEAFHHCMEKYWPNHPEVIYKTETIQNPYYKTIAIPCELSKWTNGIRQFLNQIDSDIVLLMMDDCFIRKPVDIDRIAYLQNKLTGNIALFNFEKSFDKNDMSSDITGFKKRRHGSNYEVSIMCGLWDKQKLLQVISEDCSPWEVEYHQNNCNFDYYINSADFIIDWGYEFWKQVGIAKGKWKRETILYLENEGIVVDTRRGIVD